MTTIAKYTELSVPGYALSYLVNGDDSGIEPEDKANIDEWYSQFEEEAQEVSGHVIFAITDNDSDSYFTWNPEFGLACNCYDCTILIVK